MSASVSACPLLGRLQIKPEVHPEWASLVFRKEPCPTPASVPRGVCPVAAFQMALRTLALRLACSVSFHSHGCSLRSVQQPSPCTDRKTRLRKAVYLSVAPARCLRSAWAWHSWRRCAGTGQARTQQLSFVPARAVLKVARPRAELHQRGLRLWEPGPPRRVLSASSPQLLLIRCRAPLASVFHISFHFFRSPLT